jgi:hypothetical protein
MSEKVSLAGWKLRWGFEKLRPYWHFLPDELTVKIMAVYNKQADPDELSLTRAEFDRMVRDNREFLVNAAWGELRKHLA